MYLKKFLQQEARDINLILWHKNDSFIVSEKGMPTQFLSPFFLGMPVHARAHTLTHGVENIG